MFEVLDLVGGFLGASRLEGRKVIFVVMYRNFLGGRSCMCYFIEF